METEKYLEIKFQSGDLDEELTIRAYLQELLHTLWEEEEGFSGKRPFGNSGWKCDLKVALIEAKAVPGKLDADGYIVEIDDAAFNLAMFNAINAL
jgi:hypothetical protein